MLLKLSPLRNLLKRLGGRDARHRLGAEGEKAAREFLEKAGYEFVARNVRTPVGEIDLVLRDGNCLVIVEVKVLKSDAGLPAKLQVNRDKQKRLRKLALSYYKSSRWKGSVRIDVLGRNGNQPFEHIKGAVPIG